MSIDPKWHKKQIEKYSTEYSHYEIYADVLKQVLKEVCKLYAPEAIVQSRAKTLSSFAEKAIRRKDKFQEPATQLADLCGARVICNTLDEVEMICSFIEKNFDVEEQNSEGRKPRQRTEEFGYNAVHYIVQTRKQEILKVPLPLDVIGDRKAEIQVKTLLQHAWASISHDQFYKSDFKKPDNLKRSMARLSALLEEADGSFARVIEGLNAYKLNYGAYLKKDDIKKEIAKLKLILQNEPDEKNRPFLALKIARIAKAACDWKTVERVLGPYAETDIPVRQDIVIADSLIKQEIMMEHGHALCRLHKEKPESSLYKKGQDELGEVIASAGSRPPVQALCYLAWSYAINMDNVDDQKEARKLYRSAFEQDPLNPYIIAPYLAYEMRHGGEKGLLPLMHNTLINAIDTCRAHVDAGIEMPWAFFTIGRFTLLLGKPYESLGAYAKAIHHCCDQENAYVEEDVFDDELKFLNQTHGAQNIPPEYRWAEKLLLLGKAAVFHKERPTAELRKLEARQKDFRTPVIIVAGGTDPEVEELMQTYKHSLMESFRSFTGTVISGGTTSGIPGIMGAIAENLKKEGAKKFELIGYLPRSIPKDVRVDVRYDEIVYTEDADFSPLQLLQNWIDLVAAGVKPSEVKVLGINGGRISALEYRFAIALGAAVGVVESSGRAVSELIPDANWWEAKNLLWLPDDPMSIRAFVKTVTPSLSEQQLQRAGKSIHKKFLKENRYKSLDPVMMPWELLRDDIRRSNIDQAAYMEEILRAAGCGIRSSTGKGAVSKFKTNEVEKMAEMEHGRWNVERLKSGWTYGAKKDTEKKISPYLVEWDALTDEVKEYDREAVSNWPEILKQAGFKIYRLPKVVGRPVVQDKSRTKTRKKETK